VGTTLVAFISQITGGMKIQLLGATLRGENLAVGALVIVFAIGFVLFCKADKLVKEQISV
jgi:hypothetical protein